MKRDNGNVVDFAERQSKVSRQQPPRSAEHDAHRLDEANQLLHRLRNTKRLSKADQSAIVGNLGRVIVECGCADTRAIALRLLEKNEHDKRKRYIRFPGESAGPQARYAASGGSFARIVDRLIQWQSGENLGQDQAKVDTVRKVLKGTSFLPRSQFRLPVNKDHAEAAQFAVDMQNVFDKLAEEANLADFFALLSKHPIFPDDAWYQWTNSLEITVDHEPNRILLSDWGLDEDELQDSIPWWAPRCIIGHWYVPFSCKIVRAPSQEATAMGSSIAASGYDNAFYDLVEPFLSRQYTSVSTIYHRLPLWLIALPQSDRLVPYLYISAQRLGGFYPNQTSPMDGDPVLPCFVGHVGQHIRDDGLFQPDRDNDECNTLFVRISKDHILAIGSQVDEDVSNFRDELSYVDMQDGLPQWLQEHPAKQLLALSRDSETAMHFALSARNFCGRKCNRGDATVFRPSFPNDGRHSTGPSQDTIAAYLLRNMVSSDGLNIFDAIKLDAVAKHTAARAVINDELSKFRQVFEQRYKK
jgi:hypothetical protein